MAGPSHPKRPSCIFEGLRDRVLWSWYRITLSLVLVPPGYRIDVKPHPYAAIHRRCHDQQTVESSRVYSYKVSYSTVLQYSYSYIQLEPGLSGRLQMQYRCMVIIALKEADDVRPRTACSVCLGMQGDLVHIRTVFPCRISFLD